MLLYQERVVTERNELTDKIVKLTAFRITTMYETLPEAERVRLSRQLDFMEAYQGVLDARIVAFKGGV